MKENNVSDRPDQGSQRTMCRRQLKTDLSSEGRETDEARGLQEKVLVTVPLLRAPGETSDSQENIVGGCCFNKGHISLHLDCT